MILVQESFGSIIVPYGINLAKVLWDIANGLGLVFLPFVAAMISSTMRARAQGSDEGSPAVLAVKIYEKSFISMLFILVFFVIPWEGQSDVSYKTFMCGVNGEESALSILYQNRPEVDASAKNILIDKPELPLAMGLANNVTVGSVEAMSSTVPCSPSLSQLESKVNESYVPLKDKALASNLKKFNKQCFTNAIKRRKNANASGRSTLQFPYDRENNYFWGLNYRKAYDGTASTSNIPPLMFTIEDSAFRGVIRDQYKPDNYEAGAGFFDIGKTNDLSMTCSEAAQEYRLLLEDEIKKTQSEEIETSYQAVSVMPAKDGNEMPYNIRKEDVVNGYVNQAFIDAITGKKRIVENTPDFLENRESGYVDTVLSNLELAGDTAVGVLKGDTDTYEGALTAMGFAWNIPAKASEQLNMYVVLPMMISVILTIVYAASPLIIVLSGYSWKMVYNIIFLFFFLAMMYFLLNVSFIFTNTLFMLSDSFYGSWGIHSNAELALDFVAYWLPAIVLIAWGGLGLMAGLKLGAFLTSILSTVSVAAAQKGFATLSNAALSAMPGGKAASAGKKQVSK